MIELPVLQRFVAPAPIAPANERCELCAEPVAAVHRHVVDLERQGLHCACQACAILFAGSPTRYRTVPERVARDDRFAMTAAAWSALGVPVGLAFVFQRSMLGRPVLCYPGPAGVTEADSPPGLWEALVAASPLAASVQPDVEALLVHGERGAQELACFVIPIDVAYALAGRLRRSWQGFTGGAEAERALAAFFAELAARGGGR
jgi:hypothetical protein